MRAFSDRRFVAMHDQTRADRPRELVTEREHLFELVTGIDVQQRKRNRPGMKRFPRQMHKHTRIFSDRIEQNRIAELRDDFAEDVNGFRFERFQMTPMLAHWPSLPGALTSPCG